MAMWRWLIERETQQFSRAFIYLAFVFASLLVASVLFGVLQSTGALRLMWRDAGTEAEFAGAFAGFLILLMFLIRSYDRSARDRSQIIRGNVYLPSGVPAEGARVFVEGIDRDKRADATGGFAIEVDDRAEYRVKAVLDDRVGEVVWRNAHIRTPVAIKLGEPIGANSGLSTLLILVKGAKGDVQRCALRIGTTAVIGRDRSSHIMLPAYDDAASRRHAVAEVLPDRLRISDAQSRNGTYLNGQRITAADAGPGDVLRCGKTELEIASAFDLSDATVPLSGAKHE